MRHLLTTFAISLSLLATNVFADQKTVAAIEKAGGTLTKEEASALKDAKCAKPSQDCQAIVDEIANLIAAYSTNDQMVEAILRGAVDAHPELSQQFADAAIASAPEAVALIAGLMTEIAPTAAGAPGLAVAAANANPANNIPTPAGGGGSSSPN